MSTLNTLYLMFGILASLVVIVGGGVALVRFEPLRQRFARIKARIERPRKEREALERRISNLEEDLGIMKAIMGKEMELHDATRTQVTQAEARVESYVRMLTEAREQIGDLRRIDAELDTNTQRSYDEIAARLQYLEALTSDPAKGAAQFWEGLRLTPSIDARPVFSPVRSTPDTPPRNFTPSLPNQNPLSDYPPRDPELPDR